MHEEVWSVEEVCEACSGYVQYVDRLADEIRQDSPQTGWNEPEMEVRAEKMNESRRSKAESGGNGQLQWVVVRIS